jgi:DNA-binding NarL/FixJ family response regulator
VSETQNRVLVVDHNVLLLDGICTLIRLQSDMEIVGTATSANEAVKLFREHRPKVVLMDLDLPESGGIVAIREIHAIDPATSIFGLFTHPSDECARLALRAGARSCVTKDRLNRDLVAQIRDCFRPST